MSTLEHNNYNIRLRTDIDRSTVHWPVTCNHLLSGSLALEALLAGVHCKKRYINVWIQYNTIQYITYCSNGLQPHSFRPVTDTVNNPTYRMLSEDEDNMS